MTNLHKDSDLHYPDGSHRTTPASANGHALENHERRLRAHLDRHEAQLGERHGEPAGGYVEPRSDPDDHSRTVAPVIATDPRYPSPFERAALLTYAKDRHQQKQIGNLLAMVDWLRSERAAAATAAEVLHLALLGGDCDVEGHASARDLAAVMHLELRQQHRHRAGSPEAVAQAEAHPWPEDADS